MNYKRIHDQIIDRAKSRTLPNEVYTESHHIVPKSMGGSNDKSNLVNLTAREHYLIHWLLCKIYPMNNKLIYAWNHMCAIGKDTQPRYTSHSFRYAREKLANVAKNRVTSDETKLKLSIASKAMHNRRKENGTQSILYRRLADTRMANGYRHSQETKDKIGLKHKGKILTDDQCKVISNRFIDLWSNPEYRERVISSRTGFKHSSETIEKMKISNTEEVRLAKSRGGKTQKGKPKPKTSCPHCGTIGAAGIMKRWHFDRCKYAN